MKQPTTMKTFYTIWIGQLISMLGSGLTSFALGVWIFSETGQATPFALTVLFGNLPRTLLAPIAGAIADRWNRRLLMILADCGNALVTLGVVLLLSVGKLEIWHIYVIAFLGSIFAAFQEPAYTASIAMLVPKAQLPRASGLMQMGQAIEMLISPVLAGILFVAIGLQGIILIDFVTFFFAVGALLVVHIPQPEPTHHSSSQKMSFWHDMGYGWRYLHARPGLFGLVWYYALVNFFLNLASVLTGPLVLSFNSASALGVVQAASGVGMLAGSIVISAWGGPKERRIRAVIGFISLMAVGLVLVGIRPNLFFICAGLFTLLFGAPLATAPSQAIFQTKVEPAVQGRVFAARSMVSRSTLPLAFLSAGLLADNLFGPLMNEGGELAKTAVGTLLGVGPGRGIGLMFVASGLILLFASIAAYANPRIRNVENELPDVLPDTPPAKETAESTPAIVTA